MSKVEVRKLGDIEDLGLIEMGRGNVISKNDILSTPGNYPVYSSSSSNNGEIGRYGKYMFDDERITWSIDGGGKLFYRNNVKYSVTNVCGWLKVLDEKKIISKYLYYLLINQWQKLNFNYSHKAHPSVIRNEYYVPNIEIKVQEEIVKILDSFTNLIDALNEELSLRQKQFDYYREKLLTFDDKSILKPINEIGTLFRGNGLQKKDFVDEGVGCIHYGQIYTKLGFSLSKPLTYVTKETAKPLTKVRKGDLVIACTSENIEDVCKSVVWEGEEEIVTGGHACVLRHNENPRYIGYFFQTHQFFMQKKQYAYGAKVIDIKTEKLGEILIPIPPLAIQQSIVEKLDAFESLIASLKEEIALRQKQYEYYREKLLTFD